jgi:quercetin dioxygenase-like cupin family protein
MKTLARKLALCAAGLLLPALLLPDVACAQPRETVTPQFNHALPNAPGKSLIAVTVDYPPGAKSGPHTHAKSAFIYGYIVSGAIQSQVDDQPAKVYRAGESFYEMPGAHHRVSENASDSEPARLLAVFVVDSNDSPLTTPDSR